MVKVIDGEPPKTAPIFDGDTIEQIREASPSWVLAVEGHPNRMVGYSFVRRYPEFECRTITASRGYDVYIRKP